MPFKAYFVEKMNKFRELSTIINKYLLKTDKYLWKWNSNYNIDTEFCQESIFGIHKCNGALLCSRERVFYILQGFFLLNAGKTGISSLNFVTLLYTFIQIYPNLSFAPSAPLLCHTMLFRLERRFEISVFGQVRTLRLRWRRRCHEDCVQGQRI